MKKKTLAISVDEERFNELTENAQKSKMNRSTYVNSLIDKADSVTAPIEILLEAAKDAEAYKVLDDIIQEIGRAFFVLGNVKVTNNTNEYQISLLVQMTSYLNGARFTDNNDSLIIMVAFIQQKTNQDYTIETGTFFKPYSDKSKCYM